MSCISNKVRYCMIMVMLTMFSGIILSGSVRSTSAQERGSRQHEASASHYHNTYMDSRYHHDRFYPTRGRYVSVVPRGYYSVYYGGVRYRYYGGAWYRPYGPRFVVVAPPFGLIVPFLPLYYTTIWVGGVPYYYANDVYYTQTTGGYMVVEPPKGEIVSAPPSEEKLFIYPRKGQSEKQQSDDQYQCHRWAVGQTNFDPTQPAGNLSEAQLKQKQSDYRRAMGACLDARGYTVK